MLFDDIYTTMKKFRISEIKNNDNNNFIQQRCIKLIKSDSKGTPLIPPVTIVTATFFLFLEALKMLLTLGKDVFLRLLQKVVCKTS